MSAPNPSTTDQSAFLRIDHTKVAKLEMTAAAASRMGASTNIITTLLDSTR